MQTIGVRLLDAQGHPGSGGKGGVGSGGSGVGTGGTGEGRDPVLAEWGWEPEEPAPAVSVRAASALALEALSWRARYPWQPVVLLTYGYVLFAVSRPVTRLTVPEAVGQQCV